MVYFRSGMAARDEKIREMKMGEQETDKEVNQLKNKIKKLEEEIKDLKEQLTAQFEGGIEATISYFDKDDEVSVKDVESWLKDQTEDRGSPF